jgi:hypothetical protein
MNKKLNVITNIYNEEYLLRPWLEYHNQIFKMGYVIDHYSTDNSINIVNMICPHWKIIKTKNVQKDDKNKSNFDAELNDVHIREIEKEIEGHKIMLNTTEWLLFNKPLYQIKLENINVLPIYIPIMHFQDTFNMKLRNFIENLMTFVVNRKYSDCRRGRGRFLHNINDIQYTPGRHNSKLYDINNYETSNDMIIVWCGFYPHTLDMYKRKLQISKNIPIDDIKRSRGYQHIYNLEEHINDYIRYCHNLQEPDEKYINCIKHTLNNFIYL